MRRNLRSLCFIVTLGAGISALAQDASNEPGGRLQVKPTGYVQFDSRSFPDWNIATGTGRLSRNTVEVRRVRAGLEGKWKRFAFELSVDPNDDDGLFVKDSYGEFTFSPRFQVRSGQFKLPGSREYGQSARNTDFLERSSLAAFLAPGRDMGATLSGRLARRLDYAAGVFAGDGNGRRDRAGLTTAARIDWEPINNWLQLGAYATEGRIRNVPDDKEQSGVDGRSPSGYRFFDPVYEKGRRLRVGADVEASVGSLLFNVEGLHLRDQRREQGIDFEDLPAIIGRGFSTSARWRFGKAKHLMLRYERLEFDDNGPSSSRDSVRARATNVRLRAMNALTLGASWKPQKWLRFMGNAGMERFPESRSAPESGRKGPYFTLGARLQVEIP